MTRTVLQDIALNVVKINVSGSGSGFCLFDSRKVRLWVGIYTIVSVTSTNALSGYEHTDQQGLGANLPAGNMCRVTIWATKHCGGRCEKESDDTGLRSFHGCGDSRKLVVQSELYPSYRGFMKRPCCRFRRKATRSVEALGNLP